jgi:hypothetical protein
MALAVRLVAGLVRLQTVRRKVPEGPLEGRMVCDRARTVRPCPQPNYHAVRMVTTFSTDMSSLTQHNMARTEKLHLLPMFLTQLF